MQSENLEKLTINYLTENEYRETKEKGLLNENELYMTPDDNGFGSVDVYSYNEVKTNKIWVDGKPIYRTVLVTTKPNTDIAHNIQNIDVITDLTTKVKQTSGMYFKADSASTFANKTIYVVYNDKISNITGEFTTILEYTKTTD